MEYLQENCPVRVSVRIRPLEVSETAILTTDIDDQNNQLLTVGNKAFMFDNILNGNEQQDTVYDEVAKQLVNHVLRGFSCTVLAYGQTGTGKTYTMIGSPNYGTEDMGIISRALDDIFTLSPWNDENSAIKIEISFVEVYNQKVYDLLGSNREPLCIKNKKIEPSVYKEVRTPDEAQTLLTFGSKHRHIGETKMNTRSSRSHAIFTIQYTVKTDSSVTVSKLNLVDLGGSESVKRTGNVGIARQEGININQSLLSLRQVLTALSNNEKVIPFRDSLLTVLLYDSLTAKNYISLIACVSPSSADYNETISTLRFAESTKHIKSRPEIDMIFRNRQVQNPDLVEKINHFIGLIPPTPFKKKGANNHTICTPVRPVKRPLIKMNNTFSPGDNRGLYSFSDIKRPCLSELQENEDTNASIISYRIDPANTSTSTIIETVEPTNTFSPIVRKCTEAVENKLNDLISSHLHTILGRKSVRIALRSKDSTPDNKMETGNQMDHLLQTIDQKVTELVNEKFLQFTEKTRKKRSEINIAVIPQRKLFINNDLSEGENNFKIPDLPLRKLKNKKTKVKATDVNKENLEGDENLRIPNISNNLRRSLRNSTVEFENNVLEVQLDEKVNTRRSVRLSMLKESYSDTNAQNIRRSSRVGTVPLKYSPEDYINSAPSQQTVKTSRSNKTTKLEHKQLLLSQHQQYVLNILNEGSEKDIRKLPTIGEKTAYAIVTYRNLNGQFKQLEQLKDIKIWKGQQLNRFFETNNLLPRK